MLRHLARAAGLGHVVVSECGSEWQVAGNEWCSNLVDERDRILFRHIVAGDQVTIQDYHVWLLVI